MISTLTYLLFIIHHFTFITSLRHFGKYYTNNGIFSLIKPNHIIDSKYISIKNDKIYNSSFDFLLENNEILENKKIISISPGGYKGFYLSGVCSYIKENYDLTDYVFTGASAGAWNSLIMTYKKNTKKLIYDILDIDTNKKSLPEIEYLLKYKILKNYNTCDFDLDKLFIGLTTLDKSFRFETNIFSNFVTLENALDCCIASSNIPFVTGNFSTVYNNRLSFDGGFSENPYLSIKKPVLHITPSIWSIPNKRFKLNQFNAINDLFRKQNNPFFLYEKGYHESKINKLFLDSIFHKNDNTTSVRLNYPIDPLNDNTLSFYSNTNIIEEFIY